MGQWSQGNRGHSLCPQTVQTSGRDQDITTMKSEGSVVGRHSCCGACRGNLIVQASRKTSEQRGGGSRRDTSGRGISMYKGERGAGER